jgi:hypothetical protein
MIPTGVEKKGYKRVECGQSRRYGRVLRTLPRGTYLYGFLGILGNLGIFCKRKKSPFSSAIGFPIDNLYAAAAAAAVSLSMAQSE